MRPTFCLLKLAARNLWFLSWTGFLVVSAIGKHSSSFKPCEQNMLSGTSEWSCKPESCRMCLVDLCFLWLLDNRLLHIWNWVTQMQKQKLFSTVLSCYFSSDLRLCSCGKNEHYINSYVAWDPNFLVEICDVYVNKAIDLHNCTQEFRKCFKNTMDLVHKYAVSITTNVVMKNHCKKLNDFLLWSYLNCDMLSFS